jgi:hypothetical protein
MIKVRTFTSPLKVFHVKEALDDLDQTVTRFLEKENARQVFSVSDATTTDDTGATIGIIRVVAYQ